jgi:transposase
MASPLVSDELWLILAPLPPPGRPKPKGSRPADPARAAVAGILFVLRTGVPWQVLPLECE